MSEYAIKLTELAQKKQRLIEEEAKLVQKRKIDIANLAERLSVLTASDEALAGVFSELAKAVAEKNHRLKEWETEGGRFLKPRKDSSKAKENSNTAKKATTTVPAYANA